MRAEGREALITAGLEAGATLASRGLGLRVSCSYTQPRMLRIIVTIFAGLLGLAFGSFLNVCLTRWPAGESVVEPRSHCRNCEHTLAWWENIPVVSWIGLRGRCRGCGVGIGWRYPVVELAVGGLWAHAAWQTVSATQNDAFLPSSVEPAISIVAVAVWQMIFDWILVALAVLDAEHLWLPDWLTWPGIALGLINAFLLFELHRQAGIGSAFPAISILLGVLIAAGLILLIRWVYWLIRRREGIGLGDAKLMALLAAWLGLPGALLAFALGVVLGALVAVIQLAVGSKRAEGWSLGKLPLGTFLCVGGVVSSLWGPAILAAYFRLAGL
jgi:leader peptidase (prepilin peptidase) / N-methyltransferase